jgi:3-hydroxybutyrate dehydrogenase
VGWDLNVDQPRASFPLVACDVSSAASVQAAYDRTIELAGEPAVLINNAGLQHMAPVEEFPLEKWNQLIGVMLTGSFLCMKAVVPAMKKRGSGRIVNISSVHGKLASPYKSAYVAAKHGVLGLAKVVAQETAAQGITVNTICPGFVDTPLMRKQIESQARLNGMSEDEVVTKIMLAPQYIKRFTGVSQVAELALFLCSEAASTITGEAYNISGGWGMGL